MTDIEKRGTLLRLGTVALLPWVFIPREAFSQQQDKILRVGLLGFGTAEMSDHLRQSLIEGLRDLGYDEGRNIFIDRRFAEGRPERVPVLAAELAATNPDIIVTTCTPTTRVMHNTNQTIPLVMAAVSDPVGQGFIASYRQPGGNITGVASQFEDLAGKMLSLLNEVVPNASPVVVAFNPNNSVHKTFLSEMETAAHALGMSLLTAEVSLQTDFSNLFSGLVRQGAASLMVLPDDPLLSHLRRKFVAMAANYHMPSFFGTREGVEDGGLLSYGQPLSQAFYRAAYYVDRVARGENPAELPVEQPTQFELVVNLKTAQALGLTIPPSVLLQAGEVIE